MRLEDYVFSEMENRSSNGNRGVPADSQDPLRGHGAREGERFTSPHYPFKPIMDKAFPVKLGAG